jgi:hypothetical protein
MNLVLIDKRKNFVEVNHNTHIYHIGEKPLIQRDQSTDDGLYLTAFGCRIYLVCESDIIVINGKQISEPVEKITDELFKVFN